MKKLTINTKGEKMRKYIVPILVVAGVIGFTASQVMADAAKVDGSFVENHAYKSSFSAGTPLDLLTEEGGNHYKRTDFVENGRHGFQLSSSVLKSVASESDGFKADEAWGFVTGYNPFQSGIFDTDSPIAAPLYTSPCPEWVSTSLPGGPGAPQAFEGWHCVANSFATDPQTEDPEAVWDGTVLDDLYQAVGAQDSANTDATARHIIEGTGADLENLMAYETRSLDQVLDILFYNGTRGTIKLGTVTLQTDRSAKYDPMVSSDNIRNFNIDQTLDQDVADYATFWTTTGNRGLTKGHKDETMGIYGKLTQLFQLAAPASSQTGCASAGNMDASNNGVDLCAGFEAHEGALVGEHEVLWAQLGADGIENDNGTKTNYYTFIVDQWVVSDMWDWHHRADATTCLPGDYACLGDVDKYAGFGVKQSYSSWFRDGSGKDYEYIYDYDGGHGPINKTFTETGHAQIDP